MVSVLMNTPGVNQRWCRSRLHRYIRPGKKVLFIPFSFHEDYIPDEDAWHSHFDPGQDEYNNLVLPMLKMGIREEDIAIANYFSDNPKTLGEMIYEADIVDLPGGYPDRLIGRLWEFGAVSQLAAFPGVLIGFSAGAMVQLELFHCTPEEEGQEFYYAQGLARLDGFDIEVHFTDSEIQQECISRTLDETGLSIAAMTDKGGMIFDGDHCVIMGEVTWIRPEEGRGEQP